MELWWKDKAYINQIVDWAYDLQSSHESARVISIGQSPAWIVRCVSMIRKMRGEDANVTFVPFTGGFLERDKSLESSSENIMRFNKRAGWNDNATELDRYFNYLGHLQAQPGQIFEQIQSGQPVVFSEMIMKSGGLASFITSWFGFAANDQRQALAQEVEFHAYDTAPKGNKDHIELKDGLLINLKRQVLSGAESEIIQNAAPSNLAEKTSSRLVPMYRLMAVGHHDPGLELCPNQEVRKNIEAVLHAEIQHREHHCF